MSSFTREDWERYAEVYDTLNKLQPYIQMLDDVRDALVAADYPLLDIGCGTGNLISKLSHLDPQSIVGLDSSGAMLAQAKEKLHGVRFVHADIELGLPLETSSFATITCINVLYALSNPIRALRECCRVLRPNGLLTLVTPAKQYENGHILKQHCKSQKPDSYWSNLHLDSAREERLVREAAADEALAARLIEIALFNRKIAHSRSFLFVEKQELEELALKCGFVDPRIVTTYAGQNLFLTARGKTS